MDMAGRTVAMRDAMADLAELVARAVVSGVGVAVVMAVAILALSGGAQAAPLPAAMRTIVDSDEMPDEPKALEARAELQLRDQDSDETFDRTQGPKRMRPTHRDVLFDAPAGFDDPLEMLLGCHRRIEKQLDTLTRLREHLGGKSADAQASIAARNVLRYFESAAPNHHADEEQDLFPLLAARIDDPAECERFEAFRERIESDHRNVDAAWAKLRRPLEGIADGLARALPPADVQVFVAAYTAHIALEEAAMRAFFDRWLGDADRRTLGLAMAARRKIG